MKPAVKFIPTHPAAKLPVYQTPEAAGADVHSVEAVTIPARGRRLVATGLNCVIPPGWEVQVRSRSGLALKLGLSVLNAPGTVDSDYTGPLGVILQNNTDADIELPAGERVAQLVVAPAYQAQFGWADEARETARGEGGFGSTGRN
jgi:dUTP pyrophosphatase